MRIRTARGSAVERGLVALLLALSCTACAATSSDPQGLLGTPNPSATDGLAGPSGSQPPVDGPAPVPATTAPSSAAATATTARPGSALAAVQQLAVKGRGPRTGYARSQFGGRWPDVDRNGCDTRNDVLRRDLTAIRFRGSSSCIVASGRLNDPYTGDVIDFVRGAATSSEVQIDHVVALGDAWQKGAARWTAAQRRLFANDPLELLAVGGAVNQAKGDGDAATWLPPRTAYRCAYVARQVAVKAKYRLSVTPAERDAMTRVLSRCPAQPLPA